MYVGVKTAQGVAEVATEVATDVNTIESEEGAGTAAATMEATTLMTPPPPPPPRSLPSSLPSSLPPRPRVLPHRHHWPTVSTASTESTAPTTSTTSTVSWASTALRPWEDTDGVRSRAVELTVHGSVGGIAKAVHDLESLIEQWCGTRDDASGENVHCMRMRKEVLPAIRESPLDAVRWHEAGTGLICCEQINVGAGRHRGVQQPLMSELCVLLLRRAFSLDTTNAEYVVLFNL